MDYLYQWLWQLACENRLMSLFSLAQQETVLRRHCADYQELPVNLCLPMLMTAAGGDLLGRHCPAPSERCCVQPWRALQALDG